MTRVWRESVAAVLLILLVSAVAVTTSAASAVETQRSEGLRAVADLTDIGEQAVTGLRGCLASNPKLDVYYLIDASGSLFAGSDEQSDPDFERAPVLANSLRQLGKIPGVDVEYATGFFGSTFDAGTSWTGLPDDDAGIEAAASRFEDQVRGQESLGATNWALGISEAQRQLAGQEARSAGCQLLIWFTDGAIDLSGQQATDDALNDLCGERIRPSGHAPANGFGQFNELRQAGVVVVGAMLNTGAVSDSQQAEMQALVESKGGGKICQQNPVPEGFANGAFVRTDSPGALAYVFLQLSAEVSGGMDASDDLADGRFQIDPGVSRFVIATTDEDWTLTTPNDEVLSKDSLGDVQQVATSGAVQLSYAVDVGGNTGEWLWQPGDPASAASLYLFSDLAIRLQEPALVRGEPGRLFGAIVRAALGEEDARAPMDLYDARLTIDGVGEVAVGPDGTFTVELTPNETETSATGIDLTARIDPLRTSENGLLLAPVVATFSVPVALPTAFPTVSDIALSNTHRLRGSREWRHRGHRPGGSRKLTGEVCFPQPFEPQGEIVDASDRRESWEFVADEDGCVSVASGEIVRVNMEARNSVAANADVEASFVFTSRDASGTELELTVPVRFQTEKPFNAAVFGGLVILLIILGLLLPLLLLWLLNFLTARIVHGSNLTRAEFPVTVSSAGIVGRGVDLGSPNLGTDEFRFQANTPGGREVSDRALGRLRARTPWWPLAQPWFEIVPPAGMLVFAPDARSPQKRAPGDGHRPPCGIQRRPRQVVGGRRARGPARVGPTRR